MKYKKLKNARNVYAKSIDSNQPNDDLQSYFKKQLGIINELMTDNVDLHILAHSLYKDTKKALGDESESLRNKNEKSST